MSVLSRIRDKYKTPLTAGSKGSKSPSAGSAGSAHTHSEAKGTPFAGSAGSLHAHSEFLGTEPVIFLSPAQEAARLQVLAQLEAHPTVKRAFVNRFEPDGTMVVTLAIRGVGTGELKIPAERFNQDSLDDYAALLGIIGGAP